MKYIIYGIILVFLIAGCVTGNDAIERQPLIDLVIHNSLGENTENISINLYNNDMPIYVSIVDNPQNEIIEHRIEVSPGNNYSVVLEVKDSGGDYIAESPIFNIALYEVKTITMSIWKRSATVKAI